MIIADTHSLVNSRQSIPINDDFHSRNLGYNTSHGAAHGIHGAHSIYNIYNIHNIHGMEGRTWGGRLNAVGQEEYK